MGSQPQAALWLALKLDCRIAELRTGTWLLIHAGGLLKSIASSASALLTNKRQADNLAFY